MLFETQICYYYLFIYLARFLLSVIILMNMCPESPVYIDNVGSMPSVKVKMDGFEVSHFYRDL